MKMNKEVIFNVTGNNRFLRKMFKGTKVTKTKLIIGDLQTNFLAKCIKSDTNLSLGNESFRVTDVELEGQFDDWSVICKIIMH